LYTLDSFSGWLGFGLPSTLPAYLPTSVVEEIMWRFCYVCLMVMAMAKETFRWNGWGCVEAGRLSRDSLKMVGEKALGRMRVSYSDGCRERAPSSMYLNFEGFEIVLLGLV